MLDTGEASLQVYADQLLDEAIPSSSIVKVVIVLHGVMILYSTGAIAAISKRGRWQEALELLSSLRSSGPAPDAMVYSCTIAAAAKGGRLDLALDLLQQMEAAELALNVIVFNTLLTGCALKGDYSAAVGVLAQLRERNIEPDVITFTLAIKACVQAGQYQLGRKVPNTFIRY